MNKYNAKKTTFKGELYDSKAEAAFAQELDILKKAKGNDRVTHVERQPVFPITLNGHKICKYIADFRVTYIDGSVKVYDVKGMLTPVYRIKKKLTEAFYGIKIIEVNKSKPYWALTEKDYEQSPDIQPNVS